MEEFNIFEELEQGQHDSGPIRRKDIIKAAFGYPGAKSKTLDNILKYLPYTNTWVDMFTGSGAVTLARDACKLEVINDRYSGITDFYRCVNDSKLNDALQERLTRTVQSREEWLLCYETWETISDPVERAARWYYMVSYSFGAKGRTFGRSAYGQNCMSGKVHTNLKFFDKINRRLSRVLIENQDFRQIFKDFDRHDVTFYCDPPYIHSTSTHYEHEMKMQDHRDLLECIFKAQGFVALSGYDNELYNSYPWDAKKTWEQAVSAKGMAFREENYLKDYAGVNVRENVTECLWIKEAQ